MPNLDRLRFVFRALSDLEGVPSPADLVIAPVTIFCNAADPTDMRRITLDAGAYAKIIATPPAPAPVPPPTGITYSAAMVAPTVVGKPARYKLPSGLATPVNQQWYKNPGDGTGPSAIAGATGSTYTPTSTSDGFISVRGNLADGNSFSTPEFTTTHSIISPGVVTNPIPSVYTLPYSSVQNAMTLATPAYIRFYVNGYCVDRLLAPGSYTSYDPKYAIAELSPQYGASFAINKSYISGATPATLAQQAAPPATATRPGTSTGTGFYIAGGYLYDYNGNRFMIRGANNGHWDAYPRGIIASKINTCRIWLDFFQDWTATNKPIIQGLINNKVVPMVTIGGCVTKVIGSISGTTLTVTSVLSGRLTKGMRMNLSAAGSSVAYIDSTAAIPSGGGPGTYTLKSASGGNQAAGTTFYASTGPSGSSDPDVLDACVQNFIDNRANLSAFDTQMLINIANEWGPVGTSSNTVWRDACISAVTKLRNAGYKCPIIFDAPGSGQDANASTIGVTFTTVNSDGKTYAQNVWEADSERNTIFSYHLYGAAFPGQFAQLAAKFKFLSDTAGMCFIIGEFGPIKTNYNGGSPTLTPPLEVVASCEAYNIGYCAWSLTDPANATTNTGTYALILNAGASNPGGGGYQISASYPNGNPAELTDFGRDFFLDPVYGTQVLATPASIFS